MLQVLGSRKQLCDGWSRREFLRAGSLGLFGLGLADLLHLQEAQASSRSASRSFGKAKACILLYLYGAPSQLDTFDLKPDAPSDIRSEFRQIKTSVPGVEICEHLPRTAQVMDRCSLIRSMAHPYDIHSVAYTLTGTPTTDIPMELNPRDPRHYPFFGSVLDYLNERQGQRGDMPVSVFLPWRFSSREKPFVRGGPYGGFLGSGYDPVWTEFVGTATQGDPYGGITPDSYFQFIPASEPQPDITLDRLHRRRRLLEQLDDKRRMVSASAEMRGYDRVQQMALSLVTSEKIRTALNLNREPPKVREQYGMTLFGQGVLAARRLIENGVRLATVFWDEYNEANSAWDTHVHHYSRLKDELLPGFDRAFSTLVHDLEQRGMLEETLVLVLSEHGRTPKLNRDGGRDHWSTAYCGLFAGGGIRRGNLIGKSDAHAAFVSERPVSPKDVLCTVYHLLGIDPHTEIHDNLGRPFPLVPQGEVVQELIEEEGEGDGRG